MLISLPLSTAINIMKIFISQNASVVPTSVILVSTQNKHRLMKNKSSKTTWPLSRYCLFRDGKYCVCV